MLELCTGVDNCMRRRTAVLESKREMDDEVFISRAWLGVISSCLPCHFERSEKSWPWGKDFSVAVPLFVRASFHRNDKSWRILAVFALLESAHELHHANPIPTEASRISMIVGLTRLPRSQCQRPRSCLCEEPWGDVAILVFSGSVQ